MVFGIPDLKQPLKPAETHAMHRDSACFQNRPPKFPGCCWVQPPAPSHGIPISAGWFSSCQGDASLPRKPNGDQTTSETAISANFVEHGDYLPGKETHPKINKKNLLPHTPLGQIESIPFFFTSQLCR